VKLDFDDLCGKSFALIGIHMDHVALTKIGHLAPWTKIKPACFNVRVGAGPQPGFEVDDNRQKKLSAAHSGEIVIVRPDRYTAGR
jgi:hypothetical protein